jgi:amino-acid N-acetyltransferase
VPTDPREGALLQLAASACRAGVARCHIVSYRDPDAFLAELFTTDGSGTLVTRAPFEQSRWATIDDVGGVLELIAPLEEEGVLLKRSRELLEAEIGQFRVLERDGRIIACAALYPFAEQRSAELACIVSHPDYRGAGRAQRLLRELEAEALARQLDEVFVLTTQTAHWFLEQGFEAAPLDSLPPQRQALYNLQRNSKVFSKRIGRRC